MKSVEKFQKYIEEALQSDLEELERQRIEVQHKGNKLYGIMAIIVLITLFSIIFIGAIGFLIIFIIVIGALIGGDIINNKFRISFKTKIIEKVVKFFGSDLYYSYNDHISEKEFVSSKLFYGRTDRFIGEDMIRGTICFDDNMDQSKGVRIKMSELKVEERHTGSKGRSYYTTVFKGIFIIAKFNKKIKSDTYVLKDAGFFNKLSGKNSKRVILEDPVFEEYFEVYSEDQVEARYILTPDFMEKIVKMKQKTGFEFRMCFKNNSMMMGISSEHNRLEPKLSVSALDYETFKEFYYDLSTIFGVLESLNLQDDVYI